MPDGSWGDVDMIDRSCGVLICPMETGLVLIAYSGQNPFLTAHGLSSVTVTLRVCLTLRWRSGERVSGVNEATGSQERRHNTDTEMIIQLFSE